MSFLKKIFSVFSKMTTSRKNEKLVEALNQKSKSKEEPVRDIEDLIKTQYSSPLQTRSQRLNGTKIKAVSSLASGTSGNIKLKPFPLLKSENLMNRNLNANLRPQEQSGVKDVKPGISSVSETVTQIDTSQTDNLGLITVPISSELRHPANESDNQFRQSLDSEHGKSGQLKLVPSSGSGDVEIVSAKVNTKVARRKKTEKAKSASAEQTHNAEVKSGEHVKSVADEKSARAKPKGKSKQLAGSTEKAEAIKKKAPVAKKKSTKKEAKERSETEMEEDQLPRAENAAQDSVSGLNAMPTPLQPVKPSKKALKLTPFQFKPHKMENNVDEIKEEPKRKRASPSKPKESSDSEPEVKLEKWQPQKWAEALENIKQMRTFQEAPVDQMGCHKCCDENADEKTKRFQLLVALMLSSQTRDQITYEVMHRLRDNTCTPASIANMDPEKLMEILHPVSFYKNKTKYLQNTAKILVEQYDSDIPKNVKEMIKLPGVGPKMAHICMSVAWDLITGIGVDTHVHRISNRLGWVKNATKEPEQTRKQLELWLPSQHWREVNYLLVGFGQTCCTPVRPKCHQCLNNAFCPSANIMGASPKGEMKKETQES